MKKIITTISVICVISGLAFSQWLNVEESSITLAPGESITVNVTANGSELLPGNYELPLTITTNDPQLEMVQLPATATIYTKPKIAVVTDVPNDQGGAVFVEFYRCFYDDTPLNADRTPELYTVEMNEGNGWIAVQSLSAYGENSYTALAPTTVDSSATGDGLLNFRVIASMEEGNWVSDIAQGYSVDNIVPSIPTGLLAQTNNMSILLSWNENEDEDFDYFTIYRDNEFIEFSTIALFTEDNLNIPNAVYTITATDIHGNESNHSEELHVQFTVNQLVNLQPNYLNMVSTNVELGSTSFSDLYSNTNIHVAFNDNGDFYVPGHGVDMIGEIDPNEGYQIFILGDYEESIEVVGYPYFGDIYLEAFKNNLIPFHPQTCMATEEVFAGYEDVILVVKSDDGDYFVPTFDVRTLTEMCPGKAYKVFVEGSDDIVFTYPETSTLTRNADALVWDEYKEQSQSMQYDIAKTGMSTPIIITELTGEIEAGDELVIYAHGVPVGASIVVDNYNTTILTAWQGYQAYDIDLPGYNTGDEIELRVFSQSKQTELKVTAQLSTSVFGAPLITGTANVLDEGVTPMAYHLGSAYPNPFNPVTTISYDIPEASDVTIKIYDLSGREVATLISGNVGQGYHTVQWDATSHASGTYFVKMVAGSPSTGSGQGFVDTQKIVLVK